MTPPPPALNRYTLPRLLVLLSPLAVLLCLSVPAGTAGSRSL